MRAGGCFSGDTTGEVYTGVIESYDERARTFVVYWPKDETDTEMNERQVRKLLI